LNAVFKAVLQWDLFICKPLTRFIMTLNSIPSDALGQTKPHRPWPLSARLFLSLGAFSACLSVVFSAALAHLPVFAGGLPAMVQTALTQHQFHSLGLLFTGLALVVFRVSRWLLSAGWLMLVGLVLFIFNLYARHVLGFDLLRAWVPWGGGAWIVAWLSLALGLATARSAMETSPSSKLGS
jgi:uncharacterized membrane protein YgdD (TMEM256/DUF423 family)